MTFQLVSLKAELLRKQEEVQKVKAQEENKFIQCVTKPGKKTVYSKSNQGVEIRNEKDIQEKQEDVDLHAKSRYSNTTVSNFNFSSESVNT